MLRIKPITLWMSVVVPNGQLSVNEHVFSFQAAWNGQTDCCRLLLVEGGANVNFVAEYDVTALHLATISGHKPVIRLLLKHGAKETCISDGIITATASEFVQLAGHDAHSPVMDGFVEFMKRKRCRQCGNVADTQACSRCKSVTYCSRECQKKHWKLHKPDCKTAV